MTTQHEVARASASQHVAAEIRAELARQQLSIRRLSTKMGVHHLWVNRRISTMQTELSPEDIELIAGALSVPVWRLLPRSWLPRHDSNVQPAGSFRSPGLVSVSSPPNGPTSLSIAA